MSAPIGSAIAIANLQRQLAALCGRVAELEHALLTRETPPAVALAPDEITSRR